MLGQRLRETGHFIAQRRDILPLMLATRVGRRRLAEGLNYLAWPLLAPVGSMHRRWMIPDTRLVAVVGSVGKTTTVHCLAAALSLDPSIVLRFNIWSGLAASLLRVHPGQRHAAVEAGILGKGQMARFAHMLRPHIVVVTAIASDHASSLGDLSHTAAEKAHMVEALSASGLAVLNGDDPHVLHMARQTSARVITFGLGAHNQVRASRVQVDWPHGTRLLVHVGGHTFPVRVGLLGRHQVLPCLAAIAVAWAEGLPLSRVISHMARLQPLPHRLSPSQLPRGITVLRDDAKITEESLEVALDLLDGVPNRRKVLLMGTLAYPRGSRTSLYRRLGRRIGTSVSQILFVGRNHDLKPLRSGAASQGLSRDACHRISHASPGTAHLLASMLRPGDLLLVKASFSQRLERLLLALEGRPVRCGLHYCRVWSMDCERCDMLERGWDDRLERL